MRGCDRGASDYIGYTLGAVVQHQHLIILGRFEPKSFAIGARTHTLMRIYMNELWTNRPMITGQHNHVSPDRGAGVFGDDRTERKRGNGRVRRLKSCRGPPL